MRLTSGLLRKWIFCAALLAALVGNAATDGVWAGTVDTAAFDEAINLLVKGDFSEKARAVDHLARCGDERAEPILAALLAGDLYYSKIHRHLVVAQENGNGDYAIRNALDNERLEPVKKRKLKKIGINNNLRSALKNALARIRLTHPDAAVRLKAINKMLGTFPPDADGFIKGLLETESDPDVRNGLKSALALTVLQAKDDAGDAAKLSALEQLDGNLHPAVRNALSRLVAGDADTAVRARAAMMLKRIEGRIAFYGFFETFFFGLSLGSVLVLAAIGLAITFGVIGVINMAHGELIMLGAYTTYVLQQMMPGSIGTALLLSVPAAFVVAGVAGIVIERTIIRFLYGRPLETLLATFGLSLILQQAVRSIFSPLNRSVATPAWMSGAIQFNPVLALTTNRVVIFVFALLVFAGLSLLLKKSAIGLQVRAVSQNRAMARAMGVPAARVDALTFGLGSGIAGIAGVALSQLTNVGPNLGQAYIVDSFMVVVFGGVGNLWGTLLGGLTLGVTNKFLEPWTGAVLAKILILVFIILFIQKRPQGLFPQKGRAAG
ncbi:urea ABC transporter permease subunit UrtB [Desulfosarcina ovata]|uniref:Branched-chain amino acid ABC transporter permease n=1 Tax=Desulfosarcina ovata subsp. ovata TaxID=2752305 RepID=A0A5K8AG75_9BACT|nr:urea ABC transporter permease subunit UrtB [Desulfosarcina ovata]BBO91509.1 branched-chain amino acid ABC transporter permease [Desulfosarcina ovata subsp. ovata]